MALIFDEQFETTGYDETSAGAGSNWTETTKTNCTINEDYATSGVNNAPASWDDQCCEFVVENDTNDNAFITNTLDSSRAILYGRFDFIVESVPSGLVYLASIYSTTGTNYLFYLSPGNQLRCYANYNGSGAIYISFTSIAADTLYRVDWKWDATNDAWGWKLNGVAQPNNIDASDPVESEGTLINTHPTNTKYFHIGARACGSAATVYMDNIQLATDGWVPSAVVTIGGKKWWDRNLCMFNIIMSEEEVWL